MFGQGYGYMMSGFGGLGIILWLLVIIDLALLGIWLWKKISKE